MEVRLNCNLVSTFSFVGEIDAGTNKIKDGKGVLTQSILSESNIQVEYKGNWKDGTYLDGNIALSENNTRFQIKVNHCHSKNALNNIYDVSIKFDDKKCFSGQMKTNRHGVIDTNFSIDGFLSCDQSRPAYIKIKQFPFWVNNNEFNFGKVDKIKHWQNWIQNTDCILNLMNKIEKKEFEDFLRILVHEFKTRPDDR